MILVSAYLPEQPTDPNSAEEGRGRAHRTRLPNADGGRRPFDRPEMLPPRTLKLDRPCVARDAHLHLTRRPSRPDRCTAAAWGDRPAPGRATRAPQTGLPDQPAQATRCACRVRAQSSRGEEPYRSPTAKAPSRYQSTRPKAEPRAGPAGLGYICALPGGRGACPPSSHGMQASSVISRGQCCPCRRGSGLALRGDMVDSGEPCWAQGLASFVSPRAEAQRLRR